LSSSDREVEINVNKEEVENNDFVTEEVIIEIIPVCYKIKYIP